MSAQDESIRLSLEDMSAISAPYSGGIGFTTHEMDIGNNSAGVVEGDNDDENTYISTSYSEDMSNLPSQTTEATSISLELEKNNASTISHRKSIADILEEEFPTITNVADVEQDAVSVASAETDDAFELGSPEARQIELAARYGSYFSHALLAALVGTGMAVFVAVYGVLFVVCGGGLLLTALAGANPLAER